MMILCWALIPRPSDAASIYGYVRSSGSAITNADILVFNVYNQLVGQDETDETGYYAVTPLSPGSFYIKAEADGYADEWYYNVNHRSFAKTCDFYSFTNTSRIDFDLNPGQAPAYARVLSTPTNAVVYVDYRRTPYHTPAYVPIGEAAPRNAQEPTNSYWFTNSSHVIFVSLDGYPLPPPQMVPGIEAETSINYLSTDPCENYFVAATSDHYNVTWLCSDYHVAGICNGYFYLPSAETGSIDVTTSPDGASVYVDSTDDPVGTTPLTVNDLIQGWHTVFLSKDGYLQPRPIRVAVIKNTNLPISVTLNPLGAAARMAADIQSVPSEAMVCLDYLASIGLTDMTTNHLDSTEFLGIQSYSMSHQITIFKTNYLSPYPKKFVYDGTPNAQSFTFQLYDVLGSAGDAVWYDLNTNGIWEAGETGAVDITVNLYDAQTNRLESVVTSSTGTFNCANLKAGTYILEVLPPYGYLFSPPHQGTNDTIDSDVATNSGRAVFTLAPAENNRDIDAGLRAFSGAAFWLRAVALTNNVYLRWENPVECGMLGTAVRIRSSTNNYPSATNDGVAVYSGTDQFYEHTGLTQNQPYYYTIWVSHNGIDFIEPPPETE